MFVFAFFALLIIDRSNIVALEIMVGFHGVVWGNVVTPIDKLIQVFL